MDADERSPGPDPATPTRPDDPPGAKAGRSPARGRRAGPVRWIVSLLLAALIVTALLGLTDVSPRGVLRTLRGVSPGAVLLGLALYMVAYVLRALRFRLLLVAHRPSVGSLFRIVCAHNFLNHVLPFRTGELSYVYLVGRVHGVPLGEGIGTLAISRVMDLMSFAIYYPAAVLVLHLRGFPFPAYVWRFLWAVVPAFFLLAGLLLLLSTKGEGVVGRFRSLADRGPFRRWRWVSKATDKLAETVGSFEQLTSRRGVFVACLLLSLGILGVVYLVSRVLLAGMGYPMDIALVVFCSTLAYLGLLLPIHSFGGFGTLEAGWTLGCVMAGFSEEMGVTSGLSFHVLVLSYASLLGLFGLLSVARSR